MLNNDELYTEIRHIIYQESQKLAETIAEKCISLIEEYSDNNNCDLPLQEVEEPPCTMPVFDTIDDIISVMQESFENARQKQISKKHL